MFHVSRLGAFGASVHHDMNGYVPEAADGPWDFAIDHGGQDTHDPDTGELTDYGRWWEEDRFPEWRDEAIEATRSAHTKTLEWIGDRP